MVNRKRVFDLLRTINVASCQCPAHGNRGNIQVSNATPQKDYAFEIKCSTVRYGLGVTREVGQDLVNMNAKHVCVMTDPNVVKLDPVKATLDSLTRNGVNYKVYDKVRVEPTDTSFKDAIAFAKENSFDSFVAVGGGSVMDTCKAANLYSTDPDADFLDYVNAPVGKGKPINVQLKPMIAIPTTSGTGSETTGVSIFDYESIHAKTGISHGALRPVLAMIDPLHTLTMPEKKYFTRSVYNADDLEARSCMHLAATMAGVGIGNAGVHLCHGLAYPIAGNVKSFVPNDYGADPIIPHGLSVVMTAPAVFRFTGPSDPAKHLEAASILGADVSSAKQADAGKVLAETILKYMDTMKIENGLSTLGYTREDIPELVKGALPQKRLLSMTPLPQTEEDLSKLLEDSLTIY
ncbi:hypothetical protein HF086_004652 [Spodoptera exigua]|uniref:hydroxyacid-oxoacid transhydrogenase n=1 Tax=Spodoptera exigua TaxID=7107 RepID=A0A922M7S5_SPOEX|nr:hypothetical protein HF086_004652 [Spodoptera exigua]